MDSMYSGDSYDTPENTKRYFMDRMLFGWRMVFYRKYTRYLWSIRKRVVEGKYRKSEWVTNSETILHMLERCGCRLHVRGMDNLRNGESPVVFISNHMSTFETQVLPGIIVPNMEVTFVVKESLTRHKLFGPIMRFQRPVAVRRENPREDFKAVMEQGQTILAEGRSIVIFPQATRDRVFDPEHFNSLGVKLAAKAGVPVIPIALKTDFWDNGKTIKDAGPLHRGRECFIEFGEPFRVENGKAAQQRVLDFILPRLRKWGTPIKGE